MIEEVKHYIYIHMGKEYFTPNEDLAFKRADEDSDIRVINVY